MQFETRNYVMLLLQSNDQELFTSLYQDPITCTHIGGVISIEQAAVSFLRSIKQNKIGKRLTWVIRDKSSDERLGICACIWPKKSSSETDLASKNRAELGILLLPKYCGKGIAVEALNSLTQYCLTQLNISKLELNCGKENFSAQRLNIKLSPAYKSNHDLSYWSITKEGLRD